MAPSTPPGDLEIHEFAGGVVVGVASRAVDRFAGDRVADDVDVLLTDQVDPPPPWVTGSPTDLESVDRSQAAAVVLTQVLRATEHLAVPVALAVESMAYSMLQHGEVFEAWLGSRSPRPVRQADSSPVALERTGGRLTVELRRPEVHNALDAAMREGLIDAFDVVEADPAIEEVHLRGAGPSFCSGGDLDEFGRARDAAAAHVVRVDRSVGRRVHDHAAKVTVHLHGACVGAGIEISAFAGRVVAHPDTRIRLPEVPMGLIPGAGGTVSLPRRIGRHRTAYLALTGQWLDAPTALAWGLVDELEGRAEPP